MIPYQFTRNSSKANAFCWMTGEPSIFNTAQERARATIHAKRAQKLGIGYYPRYTSNFAEQSVGEAVAADKAKAQAAREFRG